jgi:hypothetical protein
MTGLERRAYEVEASVLRHAWWTLLGATAGSGVYLAAKFGVRMVLGASPPNLTGAFLLWPVVAIVCLLASRRARIRIDASTVQFRGGGFDRARSYLRDSIQSVEVMAGIWPRLELGLPGDRRITFSLLTLAPTDRQRVAAELTAAVASR